MKKLTVVLVTLIAFAALSIVFYTDDTFLRASSPRNEPHIVVIGAGVVGLCAARRLEELGYSNYRVVEASDAAGGLASSFVDEQGFLWDLGVHVLFSHFQFFDLLLDEAGAFFVGFTSGFACFTIL